MLKRHKFDYILIETTGTGTSYNNNLILDCKGLRLASYADMTLVCSSHRHICSRICVGHQLGSKPCGWSSVSLHMCIPLTECRTLAGNGV